MNQLKHTGGKKIIIGLASLLYAAAVIYGDILFLSIVQKAFPGGVLGSVAVIGAVVAGGTAIMLPMAIHFWFSPGAQKYTGYIFYAVDFLVISANAILAYEITTNSVSGIMATWQQLCPATPLICAAGWAVCFSLDISNTMREAKIALHHKQTELFSQGLIEASESDEVMAILKQGGIDAAKKYASELTGMRLANIGKLPTGTVVTGSLAQETASPFTQPHLETQANQVSGNGHKN